MKSGGPRSGTEIRGPRSNQPPPNPTPPPISPQSPPMPPAQSPRHAPRTSSPRAFIAAGTAGTHASTPTAHLGPSPHPKPPPNPIPSRAGWGGGAAWGQVTVPTASATVAARPRGLEHGASLGWVVSARWGSPRGPPAHSHCREKPWLRLRPRSLTVRTCGRRGDILGYSLGQGDAEHPFP